MAEPYVYNVNLNFPEAVEGILSFSLSYDKLQTVLHFIIEALKRHEHGLKYLMERDQLTLNLKATIINLQSELESKINQNTQKLEELEKKSDNHDLQAQFNAVNKQIEDLNQKNADSNANSDVIKFLLLRLENQEKKTQAQDKLLNDLTDNFQALKAESDANQNRIKELELDVEDIYENPPNLVSYGQSDLEERPYQDGLPSLEIFEDPYEEDVPGLDSSQRSEQPRYQGSRTERMLGDDSPSPRHRRSKREKSHDETPYFSKNAPESSIGFKNQNDPNEAGFRPYTDEVLPISDEKYEDQRDHTTRLPRNDRSYEQTDGNRPRNIEIAPEVGQIRLEERLRNGDTGPENRASHKNENGIDSRKKTINPEITSNQGEKKPRNDYIESENRGHDIKNIGIDTITHQKVAPYNKDHNLEVIGKEIDSEKMSGFKGNPGIETSNMEEAENKGNQHRNRGGNEPRNRGEFAGETDKDIGSHNGSNFLERRIEDRDITPENEVSQRDGENLNTRTGGIVKDEKRISDRNRSNLIDATILGTLSRDIPSDAYGNHEGESSFSLNDKDVPSITIRNDRDPKKQELLGVEENKINNKTNQEISREERIKYKDERNLSHMDARTNPINEVNYTDNSIDGTRIPERSRESEGNLVDPRAQLIGASQRDLEGNFTNPKEKIIGANKQDIDKSMIDPKSQLNIENQRDLGDKSIAPQKKHVQLSPQNSRNERENIDLNKTDLISSEDSKSNVAKLKSRDRNHEDLNSFNQADRELINPAFDRGTLRFENDAKNLRNVGANFGSETKDPRKREHVVGEIDDLDGRNDSKGRDMKGNPKQRDNAKDRYASQIARNPRDGPHVHERDADYQDTHQHSKGSKAVKKLDEVDRNNSQSLRDHSEDRQTGRQIVNGRDVTAPIIYTDDTDRRAAQSNSVYSSDRNPGRNHTLGTYRKSNLPKHRKERDFRLANLNNSHYYRGNQDIYLDYPGSQTDRRAQHYEETPSGNQTERRDQESLKYSQNERKTTDKYKTETHSKDISSPEDKDMHGNLKINAVDNRKNRDKEIAEINYDGKPDAQGGRHGKDSQDKIKNIHIKDGDSIESSDSQKKMKNQRPNAAKPENQVRRRNFEEAKKNEAHNQDKRQNTSKAANSQSTHTNKKQGSEQRSASQNNPGDSKYTRPTGITGKTIYNNSDSQEVIFDNTSDQNGAYLGRINQLEKRLTLLEIPNATDKREIGVTRIEKLPKDIYDRVTQLEGLTKYLEQLASSSEVLSHKNKDEILKLINRLTKLDGLLKQKLDAEDFDALRQLVHSMASGSLRQPLDKREANQSSNLPTKEINAIRDLERRVGDLTLTLANLVHLSPESIEEILIKVRRIEQKLSNKAEQSEVDDINSKIEDLASRVAEINILIQTVNVKQDTSEAPKPNKAAENSLIASLNRRVHSLEENIKSFRLPHGIDLFQVWEEIKKLWLAIKDLQVLTEKLTVSVDNRFNDTDNKINTKIDSNELKVLDEKLSKAIKDAIESLMSKFADKKDTRKAFKYIEALVRSANQTETTEKREGEDAMFARKPLGGWSCASCEKGLESLTGKIAYHPWNKLPYRDPVDRIARAGPGFSRMLSTLPSESIKTSRLETIRSTTPISQMSEYEPAYTEPIILPKFRADRSVTPNPR